MKLKYRLINHPFYKAWTKGDVTMQQLSKYHKSYADFIQKIPDYWLKVTKGFNQYDEMAKEVVTDEIMHIGLWEKLDSKMPKVDNYPKLTEIINALDNMNTSELLGAIQAFEIQQPEIAFSKKKGLIDNYGFSHNDTEYFDEHMNEQAHINYGTSLKEKFANEEDYNRGFEKAAELYYKGLDLYMQ